MAPKRKRAETYSQDHDSSLQELSLSSDTLVPEDDEVPAVPEPDKKKEMKLTTAFTGRLGFACLNTMLRAAKPPIFNSRTCRLGTLEDKGVEFAKELALQNVKDLIPMIEWNEKHNIRFMRLSSDMFPFASHETYKYPLDFAKGPLKEAGDLARKYGHRLTFHPGQFTLLSSHDPKIVERSIADLQMHADIANLMELDQDSVMIIHGGGAYGDKESALKRVEANLLALPKDIKDRVVLENDEVVYSVEDLLPVCERTLTPLVLDWHHASLLPSEHPSEYYLDRILATWKKRGIKPKFHYSESRPGATSVKDRRAHSDRVKIIPPFMPAGNGTDLMIEAKDKEQAVLDLYERYGLFEVSPEARKIPTNEDPTAEEGKPKKTKSPRKKKPEVAIAEEEESEMVVGNMELEKVEEEESIVEDPTRRKTRSSKKSKMTVV